MLKICCSSKLPGFMDLQSSSPDTQQAPFNLNIRGKEYIIPPNTNVILNCGALHTLPSYWGADSLVWRPSRWLDERKRSFNLHLVGIILGQQDRGSAQGRSSHKQNSWLLQQDYSRRERLPRSWKWARNKKTHSRGQRIQSRKQCIGCYASYDASGGSQTCLARPGVKYLTRSEIFLSDGVAKLQTATFVIFGNARPRLGLS